MREKITWYPASENEKKALILKSPTSLRVQFAPQFSIISSTSFCFVSPHVFFSWISQ